MVNDPTKCWPCLLPVFPYGCPLFLSSFEDPGPHGNGRYSEHMLPEVELKDFRKGAQVYFQDKNYSNRSDRRAIGLYISAHSIVNVNLSAPVLL